MIRATLINPSEAGIWHCLTINARIIKYILLYRKNSYVSIVHTIVQIISSKQYTIYCSVKFVLQYNTVKLIVEPLDITIIYNI